MVERRGALVFLKCRKLDDHVRGDWNFTGENRVVVQDDEHSKSQGDTLKHDHLLYQTQPGSAPDFDGPVEVSVVMPCLNEADTIGACIRKAQSALNEHRISGEIIIADNGSTDSSVDIATALGAQVVRVPSKGYGNALAGGIAAARGKYVVMGDADESYDFGEIPNFVAKLREGFDLVQGCRLSRGGGKVLPGAMPFTHRHVGNPIFSVMARRWFQAQVSDVFCGLRGFTRRLYDSLDQRSAGMEFATEMIIKASLKEAKITEIPITLHPDGRKSHPPHLKTVRDGLRTLRFYLIYSPRWLFLLPGTLMICLGAIGYAFALPGVSIAGVTFDAHTLLFASLFILCGYKAIAFALFTKTFAVKQKLLPPDPQLEWLFKTISFQTGIAGGAVALALGIALLLGAIVQWSAAGFGQLDYSHTMRWVVPGAMFTALGIETVLASFFLYLLRSTP